MWNVEIVKINKKHIDLYQKVHTITENPATIIGNPKAKTSRHSKTEEKGR